MRLNIITEGQSEETFVRDVLAPYLGERGTYAVARSVETSRRRGVGLYRGGLRNYLKARNDIERWLSEDSGAFVTTMFDLYRLPASFPSASGGSTSSTPLARVERLETALTHDISNHRFIPYIQLHEFEALLYSDVTAIEAELLPILGQSRLIELQAIRDTVASPEEINEGLTTSPSQRLLALYPAYDKIVHGTLIARRIGVEVIRKSCPHFNQWIARLRP